MESICVGAHVNQRWGSVGRDELAFRVGKYSRGEWRTLLEEARCNKSGPRREETSQDNVAEQQRRGKAAQSRVEREPSVVSQTGATLAPKTGDKLRELQERRPRERVREVLAEVLNFVADHLLVLDGTLFSKCVASAPAGTAPGPVAYSFFSKSCVRARPCRALRAWPSTPLARRDRYSEKQEKQRGLGVCCIHIFYRHSLLHGVWFELLL